MRPVLPSYTLKGETLHKLTLLSSSSRALNPHTYPQEQREGCGPEVEAKWMQAPPKDIYLEKI